MKRLAQIFKVRPEEGRMALLLVCLMIFTSAGGSIGGNGIDALFFSRYGVRFLPYMYIALGVVALATTVVVAVLLARLSPQRLFVVMPLFIAGLLVVERVLVASGVRWIYPVIWVGMNVKGALQALLTWGLAGLVFDTRQAKRLFPLFGAGNILGAVVGGLSTPSIARLIHAENLLLVWAAALILAFAVAVGVPRSSLRQAPNKRVLHGRALRELRQGYRTVAKSPFLGWLALSAVALAILMYSITFPFSKAVAARFQNEDALAGFLGVFQGVSTGVAFAVSLLIANRLFSRFGIMRMILVFPVIYLMGFSSLVVMAPFVLIAAFRFVQTVWQQGVFFSAYQASFNVVPPDRKDQARTFIEGAGTQAGTVAAGVLLLLGDRVLQPRALFVVGLTAAAVGIAITWRASRGYGIALVDALREGRPHVFFEEEEAFVGFQRDADAMAAAVEGLKGSDRSIRRVSAEILSKVTMPPGSEAVDALVAATRDRDASVRVSAIQGLVRSGAAHALPEIAGRLQDPEPEVRTEAIHAIQSLSPHPGVAAEIVRPLLIDRAPEVRAHAAVVLMRSQSETDAPAALNTIENMLRVEGAFTSVAATSALGEWGDPSVIHLVLEQAVCPEPPVRRAAALALASFEPETVIPALIRLLEDSEYRVRDAAVESLATLGEAALSEVVEALREPSLESSALEVLERNAPINSYHKEAGKAIELHAREASATAVRYIEMWRGASSASDDERVALLADALRDRALARATASLRALGTLSIRENMGVVLENLNGRDALQRANALETLESVGHRDIVAPLLRLWEASDDHSYSRDWLAGVLREDDPWLRACALIAWEDPAVSEGTDVLPEVRRLAESDPDDEVRAAANRILGGSYMETLPTTSLLERILLLRRVPLFAELPSDDLKQLGSIAGERSYSDGEPIATEGEPGDEMYVIVSGEVAVVIGAKSSSVTEVARRIPGDYVGEMSLITRGPRTASLIALGAVRVLFIDQRHFESLINERPDVSLKLMRALAERVHESNRLLPQELAVKLETARVRRTMAGERRVVTILFCDLTGPTAAGEHLDRDEWSAVMERAYEVLVAPVYKYEGTLAPTGAMMRDAILALFGAPLTHDDDPVRAVQAALEMVAAVRELRRNLSAELGIDFNVRVGINTGPVEVGEVGSDLKLEYTPLGDEVNIAACMEQTSDPGSVQISENTQNLVAASFDLVDLGPTEVKGHSKPINTFRVLGAKATPDQP